MSMTLAVAALAALTLSTHTDTTLTVSPGTRLELENFGGDIAVTTWAKNAVRIEAEHGSRTRVTVDRAEPALVVKASGRMGVPASVDFKLTVPAWMALGLSGVYGDVTVEGTRGEVSVETVRGDIHVTGGSGAISLQSVEGEVALEGARGRAELSSVNAGVRVSNHEGDLTVETVNGEVELENVRSGAVEASTVNGDVLFEGEIREDGHYSFGTHNGDLVVALPAQPGVTVSVATYSGEFESSFPVRLTESRRGKRFKFTLGSGSAELELESFEGAIRLYRRGDPELEEVRSTLRGRRNDPAYSRPGPERDREELKKEKARDKGKGKGKDCEEDP